jgi:uncharacterized RDD family membrane protein YckC
MERGSPPPDGPDPERPQGPETPSGPETPQGPQAPAPGPQAPAPAPGPEAPPPPPQGPPGYAPPAPSPESPPGYRGPVPPGGWQQPIARPTGGWVGRPLASWGSRLGATLIDWLVLLIPGAILSVLLISGFDADSSVWAIVGYSMLSILIWSAVLLLYAPVLMNRQGERNGQTLGKQVVGIRVIRDSGEPFGFWWAVLREVVVKNLAVGIASSIIPLIPWFLNYFWPLWDDENRALHDMVCKTHVIRT